MIDDEGADRGHLDQVFDQAAEEHRAAHGAGERAALGIDGDGLGPQHQRRALARAPAVRPDGERHAGQAHAVLVEHVDGDEVGAADEVGDETVGRRAVDRARRADLLDDAGVHHHDQVRDAHRLGLVVRDVDGRDADALLQLADLDAHLLAQLGVEVGQGFVEQQQPRLHHQAARERDALLLPARELVRLARGQRLQPGEFEDALDALAQRARCDAAQSQPEGDVLEHVQMREDRVRLEHHRRVAHVGRLVVDASRTEPDLARAGLLEAGDHAQQRRLAAARGPEQRDELPLVDFEAHVGDREGAPAVAVAAGELLA